GVGGVGVAGGEADGRHGQPLELVGAHVGEGAQAGAVIDRPRVAVQVEGRDQVGAGGGVGVGAAVDGGRARLQVEVAVRGIDEQGVVIAVGGPGAAPATFHVALADRAFTESEV